MKTIRETKSGGEIFEAVKSRRSFLINALLLSSVPFMGGAVRESPKRIVTGKKLGPVDVEMRREGMDDGAVVYHPDPGLC